LGAWGMITVWLVVHVIRHVTDKRKLCFVAIEDTGWSAIWFGDDEISNWELWPVVLMFGGA